MFKILDGREHFYQWDLDRKIIVNDSTIKEVHFCNRTDECSLVVETYQENGLTLANVPNILLQTSWRINCYGYTGDYTKHSAVFEVEARTRPTDYAYTETEILNWNKINEKVIDANSTADEALGVANEASINATNAVNTADEANEKADNAFTMSAEALNKANEANEANNLFSNALKRSKKGEVIRLDDVSPTEQNIEVKVSSKNLFDYKDWVAWTATTGGGVAEETTTYLDEECFMYRNFKTENNDYTAIQFKENTQYTFTCEFSFSYNNLESYKNMPAMTISYTDGSVAYLRHQDAYSTKFQKITFTSAANKTISHLSNSGFSQGCMVYIKKNMIIEEGITATAYTPYIADLDTVEVKAQGKNVIPYPYRHGKKYTIGGITFTAREDGAIVLNGTSTAQMVGYYLWDTTGGVPCPFKDGITYTISCQGGTQNTVWLYVFYKDRKTGTETYLYPGRSFTWSNDFKNARIYLQANKLGTVFNNLVVYPQIEVGTTTTAYEPYIEPVSYPVENGNCQVKPIYPTTTIGTDTDGVIVDCEYNRDINKAFAELQQAIISLGGNV